MNYLLMTLLMIVGLHSTVLADTWLLPIETKYCSENKKFCLKVQPKKLESQLEYFKDKSNKKADADSDRTVKEIYCQGEFYNNRKKLWRIKLDNEVSPVSAILSNNGDYFVTFDNWHGMGYGDNVVVLYDAVKGTLIRRLGLSDFLTESDIFELPHSASSIRWSGDHRFDYEKQELVMNVLGGPKGSFEVHIDLKTGNVLDQKIDRIPSLHFQIVTIDNDARYADQYSNLAISGCQNSKVASSISRQEILKRIISNEIPKYPPIAKMARAGGGILVNILVSEMGEVECAEVKFGHPLLRDAILNAVRKWKFEKATTTYLGQLVFEGKVTLMLNGKTFE